MRPAESSSVSKEFEKKKRLILSRLGSSWRGALRATWRRRPGSPSARQIETHFAVPRDEDQRVGQRSTHLGRNRQAVLRVEGVVEGAAEGHRKHWAGRSGGVGGAPPPRSASRLYSPLSPTTQPNLHTSPHTAVRGARGVAKNRALSRAFGGPGHGRGARPDARSGCRTHRFTHRGDRRGRVPSAACASVGSVGSRAARRTGRPARYASANTSGPRRSVARAATGCDAIDPPRVAMRLSPSTTGVRRRQEHPP